MRVIGLMSGTSLDGIDAALIDIDGDASAADWHLVAFREQPYSASRRAAIHDAITHGSAEELCRLHADLGEWFADAARGVADMAGVDLATVDVIGSHGQTVWHIPPAGGRRGATLQLGCPATIAELTGVSVVSDFRARDVAAGGHGAPLVPWADRLLFSSDAHPRVLLNLGGMANLSWVPRRGADEDVVAFDTGPGNALIDAAVELATDGRLSYDEDGRMAAAGEVDERIVTELLAHPFFAAAPPRSTGREIFGRDYVAALAGRASDPASLVAALTELTARSISDAFNRWIRPRAVGEVIVTGGGVRNRTLMRRLGELLAPVPVRSGDDAGVPRDAKEAIVFAALAWAHIRGITGNVPSATGARGPRVLGSHTP
ncbi:MAG TPA: anhydro-N-acetylmuramic acid kinase [Longimicrobiales bacterium]